MSERIQKALTEVVEERRRQDRKWGPPEDRQHLTFSDLVTILTEEVGELAEAVLEERFAGSQSSEKGYDVRQEAVQVAAVAVAIIEHTDLRRPTEGEDDG